MDRIAEIAVLNRMAHIVLIVALPTSSWNPKDTIESVLANLVDDRLEEVVQCI